MTNSEKKTLQKRVKNCLQNGTESKIEKVRRDIRGEKSSKDMAISGIWSQQMERMQV